LQHQLALPCVSDQQSGQANQIHLQEGKVFPVITRVYSPFSKRKGDLCSLYKQKFG
jgi:hypothetical protein